MTRNIPGPLTGPTHATDDEVALATAAGFPPDQRDFDGHWVWIDEISEHSFLTVLRAAYAAGYADAEAAAEALDAATSAAEGVTYPTTGDVTAMTSVDTARLPEHTASPAPARLLPGRMAGLPEGSEGDRILERASQAPADQVTATLAGLDQYPPLVLHLMSTHAFANALDLTVADAEDAHTHEHRGPGTIRNHDPKDLSWNPWKVLDTLLDLVLDDEGTLAELVPHLRDANREGGMSPVCAHADKPVMHLDCLDPGCACPCHIPTSTPTSHPVAED